MDVGADVAAAVPALLAVESGALACVVAALGATEGGALGGGQEQPLIGRMLGGCILEAELGRGATGVVYRGVQESLRRPVAVKVLPESTLKKGDQAERRFFKEARAIARVSHPNVVQVFDAGRDPVSGVAFIVMEFIAG